jgi:hypothetical protein
VSDHSGATTDEQTPTPHLEKLFREVAEDEFWAIRGKTINGYADLEQSLCQLFAFLGARIQVANA